MICCSTVKGPIEELDKGLFPAEYQSMELSSALNRFKEYSLGLKTPSNFKNILTILLSGLKSAAILYFINLIHNVLMAILVFKKARNYSRSKIWTLRAQVTELSKSSRFIRIRDNNRQPQNIGIMKQ